MKNSVILRALLKLINIFVEYYKSSFTCKVINRTLSKLEDYFKNSMIYKILLGNRNKDPYANKSFFIKGIETIIRNLISFFHRLYAKGRDGSLIIKGVSNIVKPKNRNNKVFINLKTTFKNSLMRAILVKVFVFEPEE
ncbi:hypothetical protein [Sporosalibacterium faouarense]|uniref:hypothetical protein n=1 Tax=Sporosalibacterium faouarense TaxID=516123 RepID=UPI00192B6722|nr:hypothetical protein [Sporosalibacterium faouarense]